MAKTNMTINSDSVSPVDCGIFTTQPISFAMAYVPFQTWEQPYSTEVGFARGTIFPCLDKPFIGEEACPYGR